MKYKIGSPARIRGTLKHGRHLLQPRHLRLRKERLAGQVTIGAEETPDPNDTGIRDHHAGAVFQQRFGAAVGMELSVIKRTTRWLSGRRASSSRARRARTALRTRPTCRRFTKRAIRRRDHRRPRRSPLMWDKPSSISVNVDFSCSGGTTELFGSRMPPNWSADLLISAEAGQRYTEKTSVNEQAIDGDLPAGRPDASSVNLRLNKSGFPGGTASSGPSWKAATSSTT